MCWKYFLTGYSIINFEINLIFLIKPVFWHDRKFRKKIQISEREEHWRWKTFFIIFKGFSVFKHFLRLESAPLMLWNSISWSNLKLTIQIQLVFHPCTSFLINNCNITGYSVKKIIFCCVECDSKRFIDIKT